jgi:partner of Y14 and mago protein
MAKEDEKEVSKSGITTSTDGSRHIPSSVRADGSVRKEIKIRPGYRPPEDIEKYKNRTAEAFRNKGKAGVLGAELVEDSTPKDQSGSASKNAKRREARKKAAADKKDDEARPSSTASGALQDEAQPQAEADLELARQKEVKKLVKKLRQAKELKNKKESGSALLPEQFEKVIKINELIRQLDSLGFDADGEKKASGARDRDASPTNIEEP